MPSKKKKHHRTTSRHRPAHAAGKVKRKKSSSKKRSRRHHRGGEAAEHSTSAAAPHKSRHAKKRRHHGVATRSRSTRAIPVEGFAGAGAAGKYPSPVLPILEFATKSWKPIGNQDLDKTDVIHFHLNVPAGHVVR